MLNDKYVIGVCITKIHDLTRSDLMSRMHYKAAKHGYKLIVFNSLEDFYLNDAFDVGSKAIYNIINYDIVDALVIHSESFYNQDIRNAIIDGAKSSGCPVVLVGDQYDGCFSVIGDYDDQYTSIIDHVIREHGATDTCYIAGKKDNDPTSERRLACYKRALEQNGLPFDESRIGYGEYWEDPTNAFMDKLLSSGNKLPQAIFWLILMSKQFPVAA